MSTLSTEVIILWKKLNAIVADICSENYKSASVRTVNEDCMYVFIAVRSAATQSRLSTVGFALIREIKEETEMDREILFRGQTRKKGEKVRLDGSPIDSNWAYGGIFPNNKGGDFAIIYQQEPTIEKFTVYADTVGQYTGLTDKNGKKIFEGDIVEFFNIRGKIVNECGAFGIVVLPNIDYDLLESKIPFNNNANFCFNDNFISLWELWWNYEQDDNPLYEVEVIGNIHDTPKLLEASE